MGVIREGSHGHQGSCVWQRGRFANRPYGRLVGGYSRGNRSCRLSPTPPTMKMGLARASRVRGLDSGLRRNDGLGWRGVGDGQPQGLPLRWVAGAYFRGNRSCRLSPTPPTMKMGLARASRVRGLDSGLRRNDGLGWRGVGDGQPQGLPLRWVAGAYFRGSDR